MAEEQKQPPKQEPKIENKGPELKHLVRIVNTDMKGPQHLLYGLKKVRGVGFMLASAICKISKIDADKKVGYLTDEEIKKLDEIIKNLTKFNVPNWMLNRRKDPETGEDKHIVTSDLQFIKSNDIKGMKKIKSYKGVRHMRGLPVRGQKTKSNFRPNKGKVTGVKKAGKKGKSAGK